MQEKVTQNYILQRRRLGLQPKVSDGLWICWVDNPTYLPYHFFVHSTIYIFVHSTIYIFVHSTIYIFVHSTIYIAYIHRRSDFF